MKFFKTLIDIFFKLPQPARFVLVGGANTVLGYICFVILYLWLSNIFSKQIILLFSFLISSSFAFLNLKIFVFQTKGNWLKEYYRTIFSYINTYIINAVLLYLLADLIKIDVLVSQLIATFITAFASYFIHKFYSFSKHKK